MRDIVSPLAGIRSPFGNERFSPYALFSRSEQGAWYDPSDFSTMFQDSAGTTPVTAAGDPVGRILDKSPNGNHASQATTSSRPILARQPLTGVRNLLLNTGFDGAISGTPGTAPTSWGYFAQNTPTVTFSADEEYAGGNKVRIETDATERLQFAQTVSVQANTTYILSSIIDITSPATPNAIWMYVNWSAVPAGATVTYQLDGAPIAGSSGVPAGRHTIASILTVGATAGTASARFGVAVQAAGVVYDVIFRQPQVEIGSARTAYQLAASAYDVTEAGVQTIWALDFDGADDSLATASVNFSGTDQISTWAGVEKTIDQTVSFICELSTSSSTLNGTFGLRSAISASPTNGTYNYNSRGSVLVIASAGQNYPAGNADVLSTMFEISPAYIRPRVDGVQLLETTTSQGTGNYGNYPLYIGSRAGLSLFYSGRLFSLIIRGTQSTPAQIRQTETWINARTGAY